MKKIYFGKLILFIMAVLCLFASHTYSAVQDTNSSGMSVFDGLPEGDYEITVSKQGYIQRTATASIEYVEGKQNARVEINLPDDNSVIIPHPPSKSNPGTSVSDTNMFTHKDYITKFEHLGLTLEDMHAPITRAEIANIFSEMFEIEHKNDGMTFHDTDEKEWYHIHVRDISRKEIMIGYHDGTFRPLENITRAEIATVIVRTMQYEENTNITFDDIKDNHWAREYISKIVASGIMIGDDEDTFRPDDGITRAEVVIIINRLLLNVKPDGEDISEL